VTTDPKNAGAGVAADELPFPCSEQTLRALAQAIVPEAATLSTDEWRELYGVMRTGLAARPPVVLRQLSAFVRVLDMYALLRYRRRITGLTAAQRHTLLMSIERGPVMLLRKGLWGLRTLVLMGYYGRPTAAKQLHYAADRRGWGRDALKQVES
jgi:hypothetical protein